MSYYYYYISIVYYRLLGQNIRLYFCLSKISRILSYISVCVLFIIQRLVREVWFLYGHAGYCGLGVYCNRQYRFGHQRVFKGE